MFSANLRIKTTEDDNEILRRAKNKKSDLSVTMPSFARTQRNRSNKESYIIMSDPHPELVVNPKKRINIK